MSTVPSEKTHHLREFADFLRWLSANGYEFAVIGGQAVSAYARLLPEAVFSSDLDIYVSMETLSDLMERARELNARVVKRPKPRSLPVAVFEFRNLEINALTESRGLLPPEIVTRTARVFTLSDQDNLEVPVADPFDLLQNKLALGREKDLPHIEILRRYAEEEAVEAFRSETNPRARLAPARRLMDVFGKTALPPTLAEKLVELARLPSDFRFLAAKVPVLEIADLLVEKAGDEKLREQLGKIVASRKQVPARLR